MPFRYNPRGKRPRRRALPATFSGTNFECLGSLLGSR